MIHGHGQDLIQPNKNSHFNNTNFISIFNVLLRHCNDYETLKRIQSSSVSFYSLFTCPQQIIWKELCLRNRFISLLKRRRNDYRMARFIWESIFYQNWRVERNWNTWNASISYVYIKNNNFVIERQSCTLDLVNFYSNNNGPIQVKNSDNELLLHMIHGSSNIMISTRLEPNGMINIWNFERGFCILQKRIKGLITCKHLWKNILIIGNDFGEIEIIKLSYKSNNDNNDEKTVIVKFHAHEISFIIHDEERKEIISSDINGLIISFSLPCELEFDTFDDVQSHQITPKTIFHNQNDGKYGDGVTGMSLNNGILFVTTMKGEFIKINRNLNNYGNEFIVRFDFTRYNSLNCITQSGDCLYFGSDAGVLIKYDSIKKIFEEFTFYEKNQPITALTSDSKRLAIGYVDGNISIVNLKEDKLVLVLNLNEKNHNHSGPIWNLSIDETKLISSSLDGKTILRTFL